MKIERAAVYARKSTEDDRYEDNKSVTRQVERARAFCKVRRWTVADEHIFVDDGIFGAEFKNRPSRAGRGRGLARPALLRDALPRG